MTMSLATSLSLTGCLSKPALHRQTFALQTPPATNVTARSQTVLELLTCKVSPLFAGKPFVYRTGPDAYEVDPYAAFLIAPNQALAIPIRAYLRNSGVFKDVIESGSPLVPDMILDVHVPELFGDFRNPRQPAAALSLRMNFFSVEHGKPGKLFFQKDYSRHLLVKQNTAAEVAAGWDQAFAEIMAEAAADVIAAKR